MKKLLFLFVIFISLNAFSQEDAWVFFNAKPDAQTYFDSPLLMLSQRSLDRRAAQNIPLDIKDVPIFPSYINQITAATGITVMAQSKWLNCLHVRGTVEDINAILAFSFVDHIRFADDLLNARLANPQQSHPVNKQMEAETTFNYGTSLNQIQMLNGHLLHQQGFTGQGKIIAVLDAGFPGVDTAQPFQRLLTNGLILGGYDFVNNSTNFYTGNSHGTLVLSTMGGYTDTQLVGTAPDAQYYLFITEDVASENPVEESNWVEACEEADRLGVDVVTSSLGYFGYDNAAYSHTYSDMTGNDAFASQGANIAFSRGMVIVASAGNEGATAEPHVGVPAEALHVLAIGAVKNTEAYATFSSIGPSFDGRVKPDVMAQGQAAVLSNTAGTITTASGTSFSGPIMAGMIATFWGAVPTLTNQQVVDFVRQSADRYTAPTTQFGYGIPDFQLALTSALGVEQFIENKFVLYPNPVKESITVSFPNGIETAFVSFYNSLGQMVLQKEVSNNLSVIQLDALTPDMYLYKIQSANSSQSGKIIKK